MLSAGRAADNTNLIGRAGPRTGSRGADVFGLNLNAYIAADVAVGDRGDLVGGGGIRTTGRCCDIAGFDLYRHIAADRRAAKARSAAAAGKIHGNATGLCIGAGGNRDSKGCGQQGYFQLGFLSLI